MATRKIYPWQASSQIETFLDDMLWSSEDMAISSRADTPAETKNWYWVSTPRLLASSTPG